jgi:hypothetical protein
MSTVPTLLAGSRRLVQHLRALHVFYAPETSPIRPICPATTQVKESPEVAARQRVDPPLENLPNAREICPQNLPGS